MKNSNIIPQRHTNKGAPAAGAGMGMSFDQATNQERIRAMVLAKLGALLRGQSNPWGDTSLYNAVGAVPHTDAGYAVTDAGVLKRDPASYGRVTAGGDNTMTNPAEAKLLAPSMVLDARAAQGVASAKIVPAIRMDRGVPGHRGSGAPSHTGNKLRRRQSY